jgi:hypothetical protein
MGRDDRMQNRVQNKGSKGIFIYILIPLVVILGAVVYKVISDKYTITNSYDQIEYINQFMSNGELNDYANKIGMKDWETDIKWYKDDDNVKIEYGYMTLNFTVDELMTDQCKSALETIGITTKLVQTDEGTYKLKLFYNGNELERWVS